MQIKDKMLFFEFKLDESDYHNFKHEDIEHFLENIKRIVPQEKRSYFGITNTWQIHNDYRGQFNDLVNKYFNKSQLSLF